MKLVKVVLLALALLATPIAADAAQSGRTARIGYLSARSPLSGPEALEARAFREALWALGWAEEENLAIEYRWTNVKYEQLLEHARELVGLPVDVIFCAGAPAVWAAREATTLIPIVFVTLLDPVSAGLVRELARPGGNTTGLGGFAPELGAKHLELLREVVPNLTRVVVLANPANPMTSPTMRAAESAARTMGVQLRPLAVRDPKELGQALWTLAREQAGALLVLADPMLADQRGRIIEFAGRHRLPAVYAEPAWAEAGGLMHYAPSLPDLHRRAAVYVDKILKGARPADLPVEQPMRFELVINMKTAKALGLTIPQSVLIRADEIIP